MATDARRLRAWRRRLFMAYVAFLILFGSSLAMAASGADHSSTLAGFAVSALPALPLFIINLIVHRIIQTLRPGAGSAGTRQLIVSIVFFTAIEAAVLLPLINLFVSGHMLRSSPTGSRAGNPRAPP